jgi:large subunit ribosomal protein L4
MLLPLKTMAGEQAGEIEVSDAVFAAPINTALMHQALVRQLSNARLGTHKTKTRGEVAGGGRKPWRQKGTGRARQGSTRAPHWVGGGTVFGPTPRKYVKALPKKMVRAAIRSALSAKVGAGQLIVLDRLAMDAPKTKEMVRVLKALGVNEQSVLVVLAEKDMAVLRSANNLPKVKTLLGGNLNVRDILGTDVLVLPRESVEFVENWLGADVANGAAQVESIQAEAVPAEEE